MGKNTNFVSHKKSKLKNQDGSPQLPSASALVEGEIAINFGKDVETLSIKNESGDVVTFSSDNYYSEKKLGSAFTGSNSATTVTDALNSLEVGEEVEVNSGDTPTGDTIELWIDESVEPATVEVYTKAETNELLAEKVNTRDVVTAITSDNSGSTAPIATKVVAENELTVSNALNDLDVRKLDASAYTPTDLSNYYTKSETSGATELTNAFNNKADSAITFTAGTGLSGGGDLSSNRTFSLAMPTTYSAETYTSTTTITSSEPIVYALVRYTGTTLPNQVCPVTLTDGQQCNVIYQSANNNAYEAVISTNYVEPDGKAITLNVPAGGYAEINYVNIKGIIFVRGI